MPLAPSLICQVGFPDFVTVIHVVSPPVAVCGRCGAHPQSPGARYVCPLPSAPQFPLTDCSPPPVLILYFRLVYLAPFKPKTFPLRQLRFPVHRLDMQSLDCGVSVRCTSRPQGVQPADARLGLMLCSRPCKLRS